MLAQAAFSQMRALPVQEYAEAFGQSRVLVLAPHPDDESLGCGGLIAEASCSFIPPVVAILTDGAGSHPNSRAYTSNRLRTLRENETRCALGCLGLPQECLVFLGYPDTKAPHDGPAMIRAAESVAELAVTSGCTTLAVSWRHDPHCDHAAAALIAEQACRLTSLRLLAYPIWGWTLPPEMEIDAAAISGFRLDVGRHMASKRRAIEAHRSQYAGIITDDPDGFQMPPDFIARFLLPTETYIEMGISS